jgi:hypothetical protein
LFVAQKKPTSSSPPAPASKNKSGRAKKQAKSKRR